MYTLVSRYFVISRRGQLKQSEQNFTLLIQRNGQFRLFKKGTGNSFTTTFCVWYLRKISSCYILLTEQISLSGCIYFLRYCAKCVL